MMLPAYLLMAPFLVQGALMFFDEFYYHRKRGLPQWEVWGHPLDTLTVLACYLFVFFSEPSETNIYIYIGLAAFSCLFVSKDEFVHAQECDPGEQWLHSILFIIHPISLGALGLIWPLFHNDSYSLVRESSNLPLQDFVQYQFGIILLFLVYQITYWGIPWRKFLRSK